MGLFDSFQFNPQTYGGGGLLERLGMGAPLNMPGQGFQDPPTSTVAYGGQQVPVFGQPDPAAIPPAAQPAQYQQQAPQQSGNPLLAGLQGFGEGGREGGLIGALTGGIGGFSRGETRENQTIRALTNAGISKDMAATIAADPGLLRAVMPQMMGTAGQTSDIKEYQFAKGQGFKGTLEEWMQRKRAGAGEYSLTPVYGTNEKGETILLQPGKSGAAIQTQLPPGVKISSGVEKLDLGTQWGVIDKRTGQIVGYQPKDVTGKASAEAQGKGQGEAKLLLPQTATAVDSALRVIGDLRAHPGIDVGTGLSSVVDPRSWVPGQSGYDFNQANEQAKGKAFMVAREALKGAGQVTDFEGQKGEQAIANLKTSQSKGQYLKALDELERMLKLSYENLQKKAGVSSASPSAPVAAPGADLRKKYGLE